MGVIETSRAGIMESWLSSGGSPILYPLSLGPDGKQRGGISVCIPGSGLPVEEPVWQSVSPLSSPEHHITESSSVDQSEVGAGCFCTRQYTSEFGGTTTFPWRFHVMIRYFYNAAREQVVAQLVVTRLRDCSETSLMPFSGGISFSFATGGSDFMVMWEGTHLTSAADFVKGYSSRQRNGSILLTRGREVIELLPVTGFDRFVVLSADTKEYLSIVPTGGTYDTILLHPGETWGGLAMVTHHLLQR